MDEKGNNDITCQYDEVIENFIQVIAKNMTLYGVTPSIGRLYGVLYFSERPMTLDEMRDALEMSKTSMSTGVRALTDMKMVESTFKKGVRKDLYQTEGDWYKSFTTLFSNHWKQYVETSIEKTEQAIKELNELKLDIHDPLLKEKVSNDISRLIDAKEYYSWLMRFIFTVESGEIFDFVPKKKEK